jgi:hypothetical protein
MKILYSGTKNKVKKTLYWLIRNKKITSVRLAQLTNVGYPPRKIQILKELHGIEVGHTLVDYITSEGRKCKIAMYELLSPKKDAIKVYEKLTA